MSKSMYKYKSLACIYLALTIATGTFGVYKAIPTVIKNKGTVMTDVKDKLDANVNDETSVIHGTGADNTDKTTETVNNSTSKNTDPQHIEIEPIDLEDSPGTPNTTATPNATNASNNTNTANTTNNLNTPSTPNVSTDGLFTPKESQPQQPQPQQPQQSQPQKPQPQVTQSQQPQQIQQPQPSTAQQSQQSQAVQPQQPQAVQPQQIQQSQPQSQQTPQPQTAQPPTQPSTQTQNQPSTETQTQSTSPETSSPEVAEKDGLKDLTHPSATADDIAKLTKEKLIPNTEFRVSSVADYKLSADFASCALNKSKQEVSDYYLTLVAEQPTYALKYDSDKNVIFVILKTTDNVDIMNIFTEADGKYPVFYNSDEHVFQTTLGSSMSDACEEFQVSSSPGYNGHIECTIADIPVVICNAPAIEPYLDSNLLDSLTEIKEQQKENAKGENPTDSDTLVPFEDYDFSSTGDFYQDLEQDTEVPVEDFSDYDYSEQISSDIEQESEYSEEQDTLSQEIASLKEELRKKKEENIRNKFDFGQATDDISFIDNNTVDPSELAIYDDIQFDTYSETGEQVDLKRETLKSMPSTILKGQKLEVTTEMPETEVPMSVYLALMLSIFNLAMYARYVKLYKDEYRRYLETRGLLGVVEVDEVNTINAEDGALSLDVEREVIDSFIDLVSMADDEDSDNIDSLDLTN